MFLLRPESVFLRNVLQVARFRKGKTLGMIDLNGKLSNCSTFALEKSHFASTLTISKEDIMTQ
jgi:hypothetical protein